MAKYKPEQGTYARTTCLWLLGGLWLFGCVSLYYWLLSFRGEEGNPGFLVKHLSEGNLPVLSVPLTWALVLAVVVGVAGVWIVARQLDRPKVADMLIDSETEMRKCTWPSWGETFNSSIVILVVMLFFTAVLASMDYLLNTVIREYIL